MRTHAIEEKINSKRRIKCEFFLFLRSKRNSDKRPLMARQTFFSCGLNQYSDLLVFNGVCLCV